MNKIGQKIGQEKSDEKSDKLWTVKIAQKIEQNIEEKSYMGHGSSNSGHERSKIRHQTST